MEQKQNSDVNQGHNCVVNLQKWTYNNPKVNAYANFD